MSESERRSSPQEKFISFEEQQKMLRTSHAWLGQVLENKRDPEFVDALTVVPATPEAVSEKGELGNLIIYLLDNEHLVEYSTFTHEGKYTSVTHYLLNQKNDGAWNLETTGDLFVAPKIINNEIEFRGHEMSDHEERFYRNEPLYPELFEKATANETLDFINLVETAMLGSTILFFNEVDGFMQNITQMQQYADHLSGDTAFNRWRKS